MRPNHAIRNGVVSRVGVPVSAGFASGPKQPDFQCTILRAFELRKGYREVFLLKEIQGYSMLEIAAILGISIDTALARWESARREIGHLGDSDAMELTR